MSGSGLSGFIGLCDADKWIKAISLSAYLESMRRAKLLHDHILKTAEYKTQLSRLAKVQGLLFEDINEKDANKLIIYIFNILYESSPERFTASYHNQITKLTNKDKTRDLSILSYFNSTAPGRAKHPFSLFCKSQR